MKKFRKDGFIRSLRMSFLNFNFVMIYKIHKILALLKNHLIYLKDNIFKCFLSSIINFDTFFKKINFIHNI